MNRTIAAIMGVAILIVITRPAWAESWDCDITGIGGQTRWDVKGNTLVGPALSDLAPSPRIELQIITNTDKALVAYNNNGNVDGVQIDVVTISKPDGEIQFRLLDVRSVYEEHYKGKCLRAEH